MQSYVTIPSHATKLQVPCRCSTRSASGGGLVVPGCLTATSIFFKQRYRSRKANLNRQIPTKASYGDQREIDVRIRSEVEAPFRTVRFVLFGFFVVSASVGALIATTQLIAALRGAPNALAVNDVAQSLAIDLAAAGGFGFLFRQDLLAREKQIARLTREENLGALSVVLASGKRVRLSEMRSFARVVLVAGTPAQVDAAVGAAEPFRELLVERGVLVVPLPMFGDPQAAAEACDRLQSTLTPDDLRWRAAPVRLEKWREWFAQQARLANVSEEKGLYVGLRIDGRVRASGTGIPPWGIFAAQLAPLKGIWQGFGDGFDGRVGPM
eukprot:jgi/Botrbrau1/5234/Bobra.0172s0096.1